MAAVAAASAELLIIGWYIFRVLLQVFRYSLQKLAYTVSRTGRQVLGSAGSEPPTEGPAPSPGRPCHQMLLCISASTGANAAQEWGSPVLPRQRSTCQGQ